MKKYKIIFIDIDGTLKDSNHNISAELIDEISLYKSKGVPVILTSGRSLEDCISINKLCNGGDYIISSNGSEVYDINNKKFIYQNFLPRNIIDFFLEKTNIDEYKVLINNGFERGQIKDFNSYGEMTQLIITSLNTKAIELIFNSLNENEKQYISNYIFGEVSNRNYFFLDITNKASKIQGIMKLLDYLKIDKSEAIGIGDNYNDICMKELGLFVSMGNAKDEVKKEADLVIDTNDDNGVYKFMKEMENSL